MKTEVWLAFIVYFSAASAHATFTCPASTPIDDKSVFVFVANNGGLSEVDTAKRAACDAGQRIEIIPPEDQLQQWSQKLDLLDSARDAACQGHNTAPKDGAPVSAVAAYGKCQDAFKTYNAEKDRVTAVVAASKFKVHAAFVSLIQNLKAQGAQIKAVDFSGHDGGGFFSGPTGGIGKNDFFKLVKDNPAVLGNLQSVQLLGCWLTVPPEIDQWRAAIPSLRLLGGFVGSAPASYVAADHSFLHDMLVKQNAILSARSASELQKVLESQIKGLQYLNVGIYATCGEGDTNPLYYSRNLFRDYNDQYPNGAPKATEHVSSQVYVGAGDSCRQAFQSPIWRIWDDYFTGDKVADMEGGGDIATLYNFVRNADCQDQPEAAAFPSADQLLMMRFYPNVKQNFNKYYFKELTSADQAIARLSKDVPVSEAAEYKPLVGDSLIAMSRKEVNHQIGVLTAMRDQFARFKGEDNPDVQAVSKALTLMDANLYQLRCLPEPWHDYSPAATLPAPTCTATGAGLNR